MTSNSMFGSLGRRSGCTFELLSYWFGAGANVKYKFPQVLWFDRLSHMTSFSQSGYFISAKFAGICLWHLFLVGTIGDSWYFCLISWVCRSLWIKPACSKSCKFVYLMFTAQIEIKYLATKELLSPLIIPNKYGDRSGVRTHAPEATGDRSVTDHIK